MLNHVQRLVHDPLLADPAPWTASPPESLLQECDNVASLRDQVAALIEREMWQPGAKKRRRDEDDHSDEHSHPDFAVVAVPEAYPTHPQAVQLLAELYYLTQTLPLTKLLPSSHKVLITENFELALLEGKIAVLYLRIEELKRQGKWLLRQPQRHYDPFAYVKKNKRREFAWDAVVKEGQWMAEDFKQGARWKRACCVAVAEAVQAYWDGDDVTVRAKPPKLALKPHLANPVLYLNLEDQLKNDAAIVRALPKYVPFDHDLTAYLILKLMELPLVPVLRLIHPVDRENDWFKLYKRLELEEFEEVAPTTTPAQSLNLGPAALVAQGSPFGTHRRLTFLRPPKPPLVKNIEFRTPTIWLPHDDKLLIHYIAEFGFNWTLVATHLSAATETASLRQYRLNLQRRTPWQCFERYIQLNEHFTFADMKGTYAYHAQQWLELAHKQQLTTKRRISPLGVGAELIQRGHRRLRWALMFDAMRKLMKKREDANKDRLALARKALEVAAQQLLQKRPLDRVPTPGELLKLKFENDKSIRKAYMDQRATRNKMAQAVKAAPTGAAPAAGLATPVAPGSTPAPIGTAGAIPGTAGGTPTGTPGPPGQRIPLRQGTPGESGTPVRAQQPGTTPRPQQTPSRIPPGYTKEQFQALLAQRKKQQQGTPTPSQTPTPSLVAAQGTLGMAPTPPPKRLQFAPAQVTAIISLIQQRHPNLLKEQVTKYAALYLASLQQPQQNRANAAARSPATAAAAAPAVPADTATPTPQQLIQQQQRQQRARQQAAAAANQRQMLPQDRQLMQMQMQMRQHQQMMGMPQNPQSPFDPEKQE